MGVNNFLVEKGFLVPKPDEAGEPLTIKSIAASEQSMLWFVDWSKTKAYSMGLGKIYINLKGREPQGIVEPEDYEAVLDEIIEELEAYTDPSTGDRVVKKVYKREEIFSGNFWKEGETDFQFYRPDGEKFKEHRYTEGFADLYIGFYPKYRVSWQTSLGGVEDETIVPNNQKWSGDHVSVDPSEVPGVFMSNKKLRGSTAPNLHDIVPTILSLYKVKVPEKIDGQPLSLDL
jgi:predicted AlkP superfamily phosphohydrolase/phosphomutase